MNFSEHEHFPDDKVFVVLDEDTVREAIILQVDVRIYEFEGEIKEDLTYIVLLVNDNKSIRVKPEQIFYGVNEGFDHILRSKTPSTETKEAEEGIVSNGYQGYQGAIGPQGDQGYQGHQGDQGYQGEQGDAGVQGYQGEQGDQGEQGSDGVDGTNDVIVSEEPPENPTPGDLWWMPSELNMYIYYDDGESTQWVRSSP